jgi:phosphoribosylanthranilate isomerase
LQAAQISAAAKENGAEPIAVFVDESAADIIEACAAADISIAQLHGDVARGALGDLPPDLRVVYVLHAEGDGTIRTPLPHGSDTKNRTPKAKSSQNASTIIETGGAQAQSVESPEPGSQEGGVVECGMVEWLLVDGVSAGSGETYDWTNLRLPQGLSRRGWLLAGGLDPTNVAAALGAANPDGVDVASGVAGLDKIKKDKNKVEAFIQAVKLRTDSGLAQA